MLSIIYEFILFSQLCSVTTTNMKNRRNDSEIKGRKIKGLSSHKENCKGREMQMLARGFL